MSYAENTSVPVEKSRAEIETVLTRYGATHFGYMVDPKQAVVMFQAKDRQVRFNLPLPDRTSQSFTHRMDGRSRMLRRLSDADAHKAWEQACRQRWRALALVIKAKLEAVESGIVSFEAEFLAHILAPDGRTIGQLAKPAVEAMYSSGKMPESFLSLPARTDSE